MDNSKEGISFGERLKRLPPEVQTAYEQIMDLGEGLTLESGDPELRKRVEKVTEGRAFWIPIPERGIMYDLIVAFGVMHLVPRPEADKIVAGLNLEGGERTASDFYRKVLGLKDTDDDSLIANISAEAKKRFNPKDEYTKGI